MTHGNKEYRSVGELGEFGLIEALTHDIKVKNPSTLKGIGDDCAVLSYPDKKIVVTTDLLTEGIHFNLVYTPLKHLGYKSAVVNFSDVYAMNAIPRQMTIAMALSGKFSKKAVDDFFNGVKLACEKYSVDLVGGDTASSLTGMTICITAIGEATETDLSYRSGAKKTDLICVSGDLGAAYLGLQVLERERKVFEGLQSQQPDLTDYEYVLRRQLKPEARGDVIDLLKSLEIKPTAMIDISDGLSSEILHICKESNTGCQIFADKIPVHNDSAKVAEELNLEPVTCALNGGEDYELLFTVPLSDYEKLADQEGIHIIGHIMDADEGKHITLPDGNSLELTARGWQGLKEE